MTPIQFNKPSSAVLLDVINLRNPGANLVPTEVLLKTAVPELTPQYNTVVDIVGLNNRFASRKRLRYSRFQLTDLFDGSEILVPDEFRTIQHALNLVNQHYAVLIEPHEVTHGTIGLDGSIRITIRDSYLFNNGSSIVIKPTSTELTRLEDFADRIHRLANITLPAAIAPLLSL